MYRHIKQNIMRLKYSSTTADYLVWSDAMNLIRKLAKDGHAAGDGDSGMQGGPFARRGGGAVPGRRGGLRHRRRADLCAGPSAGRPLLPDAGFNIFGNLFV